ncbi:AI-2E family transporter [Humidisolicoccus flavus]|uniref:AI-2E family transporter n=1 Tax=Humidisolicoccus flavus TaxID=3111414 RepID=UPI003254AA22
MALFRKPAQITAPDQSDDLGVPRGMRIVGAWSWRILVIAGVIAVIGFLIDQLALIVVPLLIAALVTALLQPVVDFFVKLKWPRGLGVAIAMVFLLIVISGLLTLVVWQIREGFPGLQRQAMQTYVSFKQWLLESPLHIQDADITRWLQEFLVVLQRDTQALLASAASFGSSLGHVLAGLLLTLFATLFLLLDGKNIWRWILSVFPKRARQAVDGSVNAGWVTLGNFVRVQLLVAFIDAVGIGVGAAILGLPLAVPIAILVFFGSFIPFIGAIATGALAVFVALITLGPIQALIMLGIVLVVQQVEGHVLQPLIMGTAVKVHPLAVVVAVAGGSLVAGIAGAFFAVPLVAFLNVTIKYIANGQWRTHPRPTVKDLIS